MSIKSFRKLAIVALTVGLTVPLMGTSVSAGGFIADTFIKAVNKASKTLSPDLRPNPRRICGVVGPCIDLPARKMPVIF